MGIELGVLALSEAAKRYNQQQSDNKVGNATRAGLAQQAIDHARAQKAVGGSIGYLQSSNPDAARHEVSSSFLDTLRANSANADAGTPVVHGANARYGDAVHTATADAEAHTSRVSNFIASLMAATKQRQNEGNNMQDTALKLNGIQQDAGIDAQNTQLAIDKASQLNPWISLGANLAGNLGRSGVLAPKPEVNGMPPTGSKSPTGNGPWNPWATPVGAP